MTGTPSLGHVPLFRPLLESSGDFFQTNQSHLKWYVPRSEEEEELKSVKIEIKSEHIGISFDMGWRLSSVWERQITLVAFVMLTLRLRRVCFSLSQPKYI